MSTKKCTLCNLPNPDPPITDPEVEGAFCCTGCLHVYDLLDELDPEQAEQVRKETIARRHQEWEEESEELPDDYAEAFLKVDGMHCATCESFIESLSKREEGMYKSEASYASEMVKVYYDPDRLSEDMLPQVFSKMGYKAYPMDSVFGDDSFTTMMRLTVGTIFAIYGLVVYIMVLYPIYLTGEELVPFTSTTQYFFMANLLAMTSVTLFFTGYPILRGAWVSLSVMKPNMDLLIAIAAFSAYLFSIVAMFMGLNMIYLDVTMAIIIVVSYGNFYESRIRKNKNSLLADLMEKRIQEARVRRNGNTDMVDIDKLMPAEQVLVKAGERVPVDGTIVEGQGVVNESLITGESRPVSKRPGDRAISGTILTQNALTIKTDDQVQSTIEKMIRLMWNIQAGNSGKQRLVDRIAAYFVPGVLILGAATFGINIFIGTPIAASLLSALSVLIVSCPCALGLATPLAVASGLRDSLNNEIIFKTSAVFEEKSDTDILAFDKTGTLTTGRMQMLKEPANKQALEYAAAVEQYSSHPVAAAIAGQGHEDSYMVKNFESCSRGVWGEVDGKVVRVGQPEWVTDHEVEISAKQQSQINAARENGHIPTAVAWNGRVREVLIVGDQIREETVSFISSLKKRGKKIAIITGDSQQAARPLRDKLNPDYLFTGARPESKTEIIQELKQSGRVAMIGDGSNDALALAEADLGIAFGNLTAIAAESAQIVIPGTRLHKIEMAFNAMDQTKGRIQQNLGWAFLYNAIAIPLAIAGLINPLFAALAMAGSSLLVVGNSSRTMKLQA